MKLTLFPKLLLAFLLTTAVLVASMAMSVHWSFEHGFAAYLHRVEMDRLDGLIDALEREYAAHGSWAFLQNQHRRWRALLLETLARGASPGGAPEMPPWGEMQGGRGHRWQSPPAEVLAIGPRLRLLDAQRRTVIGPPDAPPDESLRPLRHAQQTVGWLGLRPAEFIGDRLALSFRQQQARTYYLIALLAVLVSALVSWLLVRQLLVPVRRIADAARALGAGQYQTRVRVASQDELSQLAADFNHLAHALERNEQARRQWIADISHELRTPLAVLRGEIEAMQDGVRRLDADGLRSLHGEALGLGKLVDDLYELALSDLGALDYQREEIDLAEVLAETVAAFAPRFAARRLEVLDRAAQHAPLTLRADARRLTQLFGNLLENSLRYTDPGGRLEIAVRRAGQQVIVEFQDSAPGVPDESLDKLFERLYRVDKSRSRALGGAGLGLAICRNIAEAHAGRIDAYHSPLGGLGVRVTLDLAVSA